MSYYAGGCRSKGTALQKVDHVLKKSKKQGRRPVFGHFDTCSGKVGNMGLNLEFEPAGATTQRVTQTWGWY